MVKMQYYNKNDKEFHAFIKERGYVNSSSDGVREDVSMILGGCALSWIAEFYA